MLRAEPRTIHAPTWWQRDAPRAGSRFIAMPELLCGSAALLAALPVVALIGTIHAAFPGRPERALLVIGALLAALAGLPPALYILAQRRRTRPEMVALLAVAGAGVALVATSLYHVSFYVRFPADVLIWSESDFVNDILKFRLGYPLFSAQANNESFIYPPGSQLLTYVLASLTGNPLSIPTYRLVQVGYTVLAAGVAALCCRQLVRTAFGTGRLPNAGVWGVIWLPGLLLVATNSLTNPFTFNLHNDALAQLVTILAYWVLLSYAHTRARRLLLIMALLPAAGFLVKQSLIIWLGFYVGYLACFDRPRSKLRVLQVLLGGSGVLGVVLGLCYVLWGADFVYWIFTVLGSHSVSPLRSAKHALDIWPYLLVGLAGGAVLLRGPTFGALVGPWLIWLALILSETYSSGIAWMLNHIGPGSLIASIWFFAAVTYAWETYFRSHLPVTAAPAPATNPRGRSATRLPTSERWLHAGIGVAGFALLLNGLQVVRIPLNPLSSSAGAYVRAIEQEFSGLPAEQVLLDMGTWVYLPQGVVMKDRAPTIGERGYSETGDFSALLERVRRQHYAKILVRNLHSPDFWYDHELWRESSGIRQALLESYSEIRTIPAVVAEPGQPPVTYGLSEVSVLVPKQNTR